VVALIGSDVMGDANSSLSGGRYILQHFGVWSHYKSKGDKRCLKLLDISEIRMILHGNNYKNSRKSVI
jgi:hypothetical protein